MTFPVGSTGFNHPIVDGKGNLIIPVQKSADYVPGVSGWAIFSDGSAEFNNGTFRGTVTAGTFAGTNFLLNANGIFFYSGTPGVGNLIGWWASVAGTDGFGNAYTAGLAISNGTSVVKLTETPAQTGMVFNPNPATLTDGQITSSYSSLSGLSTMEIDAPYPTSGGVVASLLFYSGNASNAPLVGTSVQTSFLSNNFMYSAGNADNTQTNNINLGAGGALGDVGITSVTIAAELNRRYRVSADWDSINTGGVAANHYIFRLKKGPGAATTIKSHRGESNGVATTNLGGCMWALDAPYTSGSTPTQNVTYFFTANHDVGADVSSLTAPATLTVEGWD